MELQGRDLEQYWNEATEFLVLKSLNATLGRRQKTGREAKRCTKENTGHLCVVIQPTFHSLRRRAQSKNDRHGGEETS